MRRRRKKAFTTEVSMTFPSLEITTLNIPDIFRFLWLWEPYTPVIWITLNLLLLLIRKPYN